MADSERGIDLDQFARRPVEDQLAHLALENERRFAEIQRLTAIVEQFSEIADRVAFPREQQ